MSAAPTRARPAAPRPHAAARRRPVDEAVVEGDLGLQTDEDRAQVAEVFVDLYCDILLDALGRQERGASPVEAVRAALAAAESARC